jgi:glutamate synthase (NADPH) small chain
MINQISPLSSLGYRFVNFSFKSSETAVPRWMSQKDVEKMEGNCNGCGKPPCAKACPVKTPVKEIIEALETEDYPTAASLLYAHNPIPEITAKVCPGLCCTEGCIKRKNPDETKQIKPYFIENLISSRMSYFFRPGEPTGKKVAVVGTGPMGITAAIKLREKGHDVVMFDANNYFGGVLADGIPEFRLPKEILNGEHLRLSNMKVEFQFDTYIAGGNFTPPKGKKVYDYGKLKNDYDAVIMATGANSAIMPPSEGEEKVKGMDLEGVYTARDYLTAFNLDNPKIEFYSKSKPQKPKTEGKTAIVIGGGNAAMDVAGVAKEYGKYKEVKVVYRREKFPAFPEEYKANVDRKVKFVKKRTPAEIVGENGIAKRVKFKVLELGEPDESGKQTMIDTKKYEEMDADHIIFALG